MRVGIDAVLISRMEKSLANQRFIERVFGEEERCELQARGYAPKSAAACFAVKEAFGKAMGCGIMTKFSLKEVQLLHKKSGRPYIKLSGKAIKLCRKKKTKVSITHEGGLAIAVVIV